MKKTLLILAMFLVFTPLSAMLLLPEYVKISFIPFTIGMLIISGISFREWINKKKKHKEKM
jgi:4-hydroxybenzoate polyprenyltransferase